MTGILYALVYIFGVITILGGSFGLRKSGRDSPWAEFLSSSYLLALIFLAIFPSVVSFLKCVLALSKI